MIGKPKWDNEIDEIEAAEVEHTLELTRRFLHAIFADPAILDDIPDGSTVVLLDASGDPREAAKLQAADRMRAAGQTVYVGRA